MTNSDTIDTSNGGEDLRRARVVILGEFSAGKSTLINLFTGEQSLRTQITATQMPAVWMSYGTEAPYRVDLEGNQHPVDPSNPDSISVDDTAYVRTFLETPALEFCDLIDTPGNSDPNIASVAWERVAKIADAAVWCSSSTQAWRQSELAAWRDVPEDVRERSILLMTRADKLTSDSDREKVFKRVNHETKDLFTHIHMASLLDFENVRPVLRDLLALCNSVEGSQTFDISSAINIIGGPPAKTAMVDEIEPAQHEADEDVSSSADAKQALSGDEMTDDMLIDSLDLSEEISLEEFALNDGDDTDMDAVLAALTTPVTIGNPRVATAAPNEIPEATETASPVTTPPSPIVSPIIEEPIAEGYASGLWRKMSDVVPDGDVDAYNAAFDMFLEKMDTEVALLQGQSKMKAAG